MHEQGTSLADDQTTRLHMSADGRSSSTPLATVGELVQEPMFRTLVRITQSINRTDDKYLRSAIDYLEDPDDPASVMRSRDLSIPF
ncbi:unnamed protein product [Linum trigynum]|uniref:Uncharacterized protein n=1 Tax=Linum trigynum TaxID=586398 RepID=A0AAV2CQJ2_9ROSI